MAGGRGLRSGWTTGACATAAVSAAYTALLTGEFPDPVTITLPRGETPAFALTRERLAPGEAFAAVTKDAGDDPDVTHGAVVGALVRPAAPGTGVTFVAGHGVGTVTLPGLPLPVGEPAVNPVPRRMMTQAVTRIAAGHAAGPGLLDGAGSVLGAVPGAAPDLVLELSVDGGEDLARRTWNPRLGILGGLSILGTTGVVVPYSCSAWIDSIRRGVDVARAAGHRHVAGCTGRTSEAAVRDRYGLPDEALLDMGDFAGAVLKYLRRHPVPRLTIAGGFAKLAKLADGHLDLHSGRSRVDPAALAALTAAAVPPDAALPAAVAAAPTALAALELARAGGVPLADLVADRARRVAEGVLAGAPVAVEVLVVDRSGAVVGASAPDGQPGSPG